MRLKQKVALITGGTSGIGREIAVQFAREGAIAVICGRNSQRGEAVVDAIQAAGGQAHFIMTDVVLASDVEAMVAEIIAKFGRLNILVNNAALLHPQDGGIEETGEAVWDEVLEVNLKGTFLCCKYALPFLVQSGAGAIVNMASFVALMGSAVSQIAYTASKGGVIAMTREIAIAYARRQVRANAICPGPIATPMLQQLLQDPSLLERRRVHIPPGRFGTPAEVAEAVIFLASDAASYINGTTLMVDGGITSAYVTGE